MKISVKCKCFDELTQQEQSRIQVLRNEVFHTAQHLGQQGMDSKDRFSRHLLLYKNDKICGYARLLPPGLVYDEISADKFVVATSYRGKHIGHILTEKVIAACYRYYGDHPIRISTPCYGRKFYTSFGFKRTSEIYMKSGIGHIQMVKQRANFSSTKTNLVINSTRLSGNGAKALDKDDRNFAFSIQAEAICSAIA
ncbi:MAG: GNAT family N-acetyltransferase [Chitinophaga sp.]|uniref:GNAT family N-acetyltransferase n=1 Tax=Chitinophaga sp. TaxID=1869181 RepID=UPI0025BD3EF7|nr:GNAT family N-acetyltransferase [Chitinophaga sp.]MBV8251426.1 GNAT family N-acetyltransferase [Chitinophaga sp.]